MLRIVGNRKDVVVIAAALTVPRYAYFSLENCCR